jgi:hypothetical protein
MGDGTRLSTDLYRPAGDGPWPTLLYRTAYGKSRPGIVHGALDVLRAVERGYAVAVQDVRGRFGSEGRFTPFVDEGPDGADTVVWLAGQSWVAGPVGTIGRSYSAALQWRTAAELARRGRLDLLGAVAPGMGGWGTPTGWLAPDGVFALGFAGWWGAAHLAPPDTARRDRGPEGAVGDPLALARAIDRIYWDADLADLPSGSPPYLADWFLLAAAVRQGGDPGRAAADLGPVPAEVPALHLAGWFDVFCDGDLAGYRELARQYPDRHRLVVGPWAHGGVTGGNFPGRSFGLDGSADLVDLTGQQLDWFDRWLTGSGETRAEAVGTAPAGTAPAVRTFVTGADRWTAGDQWPPATTPIALYLTPGPTDGPGPRAQFLGPAPAAGSWSFTYDADEPTPTLGGRTFLPGLEVAAEAGPADQRALFDRSDGVVFCADRLDTDLELAGPVTVAVRAAADPAVSILVGTLVDLGPDGRAELVTRGATRYRRPPGDDPGPAHPAVRVELALGSVHHAFTAGHRLALHLAAGSFPAYDRWAALGELAGPGAPDRPGDRGPRRVTVRLSGAAELPAVLTLPVVGRGPGEDRRRADRDENEVDQPEGAFQ